MRTVNPAVGSSAPAQSELRRDPITGEWVIIAAGRGKRPHAPAPPPTVDQPDEDCPFCPGREERTPPEISARRPDGAPDTGGWSVRVIPNLFPILGGDGAAAPPAGADRAPATGVSEVIIDTPAHVQTPWELGAGQTQAMLEVYQERIRALADRGDIRYVHVMRNHKAAGASSLEHPHSQLFGMAFVPALVNAELDGFTMGELDQTSCVLCDELRREEEEKTRVIAVTESFIAFCPFASRQPYEAWIAPRRHQPRFEDCDQTAELAGLMTLLMNRYRERLDDPPFNYWIHTYPLHGELRPFHWHLEILPRLTIAGGLELGAGMWVNTVAPEEAAALLG